MKFSFNDDDLFRIEEDDLALATEGCKKCECVVLINSNIVLIEAKSSAPKINNKENFHTFISDIRQKFADSLQLFYDIKSKKYGEDAFQRLPKNIRNSTLSPSDYKIYLIIHGHRIDWLLGLSDALRNILREEINRWNIHDSNIKVFNEEIAKNNHLIVAYIPRSEIGPLRQPNGNPDPQKVQEWFDTTSNLHT